MFILQKVLQLLKLSHDADILAHLTYPKTTKRSDTQKTSGAPLSKILFLKTQKKRLPCLKATVSDKPLKRHLVRNKRLIGPTD